ncbi:efflux RND transporter periplasmic adaptor subunit [Arenimonas fontis]|uniref:Efflux RND transporter periplasmic adaptor subunit n=1 Tax=Arenimonas fontis TaxID=2608255 RepID=A0A5B2ZBM1_9GAMM|nr:efflux RND transporter periplasmic adaptor subunit [Arenimonas fontis]KAA2285305.1 efflux RND transporter periplasmic adaptor subunit [Arenimonas fontis]
MRAFPLPALLAMALLSACAEPAPAPSERPPVQFETLVVGAETSVRERHWDGVVEAVNQATLSAQTAGRVVELPFDVNDYVEAGQVVVRFTDVEQLSAQRRAAAALNAAQADYTEAEAAFRRTEELVEKQLLARAALDQARARRDAARAALESARAGLSEAGEQVDYTVIRAPYSGILTERHVEVGEAVRPGQPLVSGLSLNRLRVNVEVPQSDVNAIREHLQAAVLLPGGRRLQAERVVVFPYADPRTHSFRVRVELPEAETGLQPGMTVKTAFKLGEQARLMVPVSALVRRSEVTAVYVVGTDNRVSLRQVRLGRRIEDRVEVLAGLAEGERIAADPLAALAHLSAERGDG